MSKRLYGLTIVNWEICDFLYIYVDLEIENFYLSMWCSAMITLTDNLHVPKGMLGEMTTLNENLHEHRGMLEATITLNESLHEHRGILGTIVTFFAMFALKLCSTQTSISFLCKTGLTSWVVLALPFANSALALKPTNGKPCSWMNDTLFQ